METIRSEFQNGTGLFQHPSQASCTWKLQAGTIISNSEPLRASNLNETLPKAQRTRGLSSYEVISQVQTQILTTFHLHNLGYASTKNFNQTSASSLNLKLKILTKHSFRISTKNYFHNGTLVTKSSLNVSFVCPVSSLGREGTFAFL